MRTPVFVVVTLFVMFATDAFAQQDFQPSHYQTTAPPTARFAIVQSGLAAKWTFKLDRYSGRVWQIVSTTGGGVAWEELEVIGRPAIANPAAARFQIFTSGLAAKHTFLIDTDTGKSWVVVSVKRKAADGSEHEVNLWEPFAR